MTGGTGGTDAGTLAKEAQAITVDGLSAAEYESLKASADKHTFQAEVSRMMKRAWRGVALPCVADGGATMAVQWWRRDGAVQR